MYIFKVYFLDGLAIQKRRTMIRDGDPKPNSHQTVGMKMKHVVSEYYNIADKKEYIKLVSDIL